jgi:AcrR family transcriptional regulator
MRETTVPDEFNSLWSSRKNSGHAAAASDLDKATQQRLLEATDRVVGQVGVARLSMSDVAREAGVARGTLYRYFESRDVLLDALRLRTTNRFFESVGEAMSGQATLSDQLGTFSQLIIRSIHPGSEDRNRNQAAMVHMLSTESAQALLRTSRFIEPYVELARQRGEVRKDLDVADASEWLARVLLSFTIFQASVAFGDVDPQSVSQFVRRYAIHGLTGEQG